jgi:hypothetical protein
MNAYALLFFKKLFIKIAFASKMPEVLKLEQEVPQE